MPEIDGPAPDVRPPNSRIARDPDVRAAGRSVVRVLGTACGLGIQGSGWVARDGVVVTNAHVVAGQDDTAVELRDGSRHDAEAIFYDPDNDLAILRASGVSGTPALELDTGAREGTSAAILGFPENGPFTARAGRLGATQTVSSQDSYGRGPIRAADHLCARAGAVGQLGRPDGRRLGPGGDDDLRGRGLGPRAHRVRGAGLDHPRRAGTRSEPREHGPVRGLKASRRRVSARGTGRPEAVDSPALRPKAETSLGSATCCARIPELRSASRGRPAFIHGEEQDRTMSFRESARSAGPIEIRAGAVVLPLVLLLILAALVLPGIASAATITYDGPDNGEWKDAANWNSDTVPAINDDVIIPAGRPVKHTLAGGVVARTFDLGAGANLTLDGAGRILTVGENASAAAVYELSGNVSANNGARLDLTGGRPTWNAGTWTAQGTGSSFAVSTGATLDMEGTVQANDGGSSSRFDVTGTVLRKGAGVGFIGLPYRNNGSTQVLSGELFLNNGDRNGDLGAPNGVFNVSSGATLALSGDFDLATAFSPLPLPVNGNVTGPGRVRLDAGQLKVGAIYDIGTTAISGGTLETQQGSSETDRLVSDGQGGGLRGSLEVGSGASTLNNIFLDGANVDFAPGAAISATGNVGAGNSASMSLDGTTNWTGGTWTLSNGFVSVDGTLNANAGRTLTRGFVPGDANLAIRPGGTLNARGSNASPVVLDVETFNNGTVDVITGTLRVNDLRQDGEESGATRLRKTTTLQVDEPLVLEGGSLRGFGRVVGSVVNSGGLVLPGGAAPGRLSIAGSYRQSPAGTLRADIDGERAAIDFDQLAVSGAAALDGTLDIDNAFDPLPSDLFKVVSAGSRSGAFDDVTGEAIGPNKRYFLTYPADGATLKVDADPSVSIADAAATEPDSGTRNASFRVSLPRAARRRVTVSFATSNGTARAPGDYTAKTGTVTFEPGQTAKTLNVAVRGDNSREPNETFNVRLSSPRNATLGRGQAVGTIRNDD